MGEASSSAAPAAQPTPVNTLGQAQLSGWLISLRCARTREGLKSARACPLPFVLHLPSLVAALGHDTRLDALQTRLRCPRCGSTRFTVSMSIPSIGDRADEGPKPRRMRPARTGDDNTLAGTPHELIVVKCDCRGGRRGQYRKETLLAVFPGETQMQALLQHVAAWRKCPFAKPEPTQFDLARGFECRIHYDVE
jgi:hypothetical protein